MIRYRWDVTGRRLHFIQTLHSRPGCTQGRAGADHTTLRETIDRAACCPARKTRAYTCLGGDRRDFVTGGCWGSAGVGYRRPAVGADPTAQPPHPTRSCGCVRARRPRRGQAGAQKPPLHVPWRVQSRICAGGVVGRHPVRYRGLLCTGWYVVVGRALRSKWVGRGSPKSGRRDGSAPVQRRFPGQRR